VYKFVLGSWPSIEPQSGRESIKVLDATPHIIKRYSQSDEQAALARVRYNRLVDTFLGVTTYSLQSHLCANVPSIGQIEIDELYVGVNRAGTQFVIPVQAKVNRDRHSVVQTLQDAAYCHWKFPQLERRCVSVHFDKKTERIVMFELNVEQRRVEIRDERHYQLVENQQLTDKEIGRYR
jgi:hypothetical protein